jgi:P27 family predicted phage terminase small subunit
MKNKIEKFLRKDASPYFEAIKAHLIDANRFREIDEMIIAEAANSYATIVDYARKVEDKGAVQTFKTGAANISAEYTVLKNERAQFLTLSKHLGLDPGARAGFGNSFQLDMFGADDIFGSSPLMAVAK